MNDFLNKFFALEGKVAALTGAGGHLIGAFSLGLAKAGVRVAVLDVDFRKAEAIAAKIQAEGGEAMPLRVDVTCKGDFQAALQKTLERWNRIDILVNGAGINAPTPFLEIAIEEWNRILAVQLGGTMLGCQVFGDRMVQQGRGVIINISSASAGPPLSKAFTYSVAKAGIKNLTQNLAREWATKGVRVNALRPGFFPTEWNKRNFLTPDRVQAILNHTPMSRFGEPEELLGAVLWLCSDAATFVTGAEIAVDGGFSAMTI
jgi:NAD(P)-dependent dehydrogenase (short-subunit alcohol dehydrogenase family)